MEPEAAYQARVGQIIGGKYRLVRLIGAGGMGAVYEAENSWIKRRVAIKILRGDLLRNREAVQRFTQEAQSATSIEHPNIVYVLDMGQEPTDGSLYIVQEFLTGVDLRRRLATDKRLSLQESLATLVPIMNALIAAHEHGIVHRDIKPENIFLARGPNGEFVPKLIDFGVSKIMDSAGALTKTQTGMALGTPYYMSPEQGRGDTTLDARTDVWSLGVVFFELLAGGPPYDAPNYNLLVLKILTERAPRIETLVPGIRADLAGMVHMALEPDRERRWPTMRAFRDALVQYAGSHPEFGLSSGMLGPIASAASFGATQPPMQRMPAPMTAPHGTPAHFVSQSQDAPAVIARASEASNAVGPVTFGVNPTLPLGAAAGMPQAPSAVGVPRSATVPFAPSEIRTTMAGVADQPAPLAPSPTMNATALGWTQPTQSTRGAPWLLFMAVAAISVFVGAGSVVLIRSHQRNAAVAAPPPSTRLALTPREVPVVDRDVAGPAVTAPTTARLPVRSVRANPANAHAAPSAPVAPETPAPPAPVEPPPAPIAPVVHATPEPHVTPHHPSHAAIATPPPAVVPPPPAVSQPPPVAVAPPPVPIPPPHRVAPPPADPAAQQASSVASQMQYAAQQLAYSDPRRASRIANDAARIQFEADQIRAMDAQARELDGVDPGTAQQLRIAAQRQRQNLQRMIERASQD